jgi:alkylation response protein AidB-like acyl-CoA dehydrogenase
MRASTPNRSPRQRAPARDLSKTLEVIAAGAAARDAAPAFPEGPVRDLASAGVLGMTAPGPAEDRGVSFEEEWRVLRAVAGADGSVGRILDGHFNAVERLSVLAPEPPRRLGC